MIGKCSSNLSTALWRHLLGASFAALPAKLDSGRIFAVIVKFFRFLAGRDPHDLDGVSDHVGGALLPLGPLRHLTSHLVGQSHRCPGGIALEP